MGVFIRPRRARERRFDHVVMHTFRSLTFVCGLLVAAGPVHAGTKVSGSLVPADPDTTVNPHVGSKSTYSFSGKAGKYVFQLRDVTDPGGLPAPITTGATSDTMYIAIVRIEALGTVVNYNIPFAITKKPGRETVKGEAGLISLVPGPRSESPASRSSVRRRRRARPRATRSCSIPASRGCIWATSTPTRVPGEPRSG
jgi:hypothetical protein